MHRLQVFSRHGLPADRVGLRPSVARKLGLRPREPLYLTSCESADRRVWVPGWFEDRTLGPDGCLVPGDVLAALGVPVEGYIFLTSGRPPQPSFHLVCWTYEDLDEEPAAEDLLVLLDVSGSMQGAPLRSAKRAVLAFLDRKRERQAQLHLDDRLGLLTFGGEGQEGVRLVCAPAQDNYRAFVEAVESAAAGGRTPMEEALGTAVETLRALGDPLDGAQRRRLIVVTDGYPCPGNPEAFELVVEEMVREEIRVATVGVGDRFDRGLLGSLAARTKAPFVEVQRMQELILLLEAMA